MTKLLLITALIALSAPVVAAPDGWSRPGGYHDQAKALGSLAKPLGGNLAKCDPNTSNREFKDTNGDGVPDTCVAR